MASTIHLFNDSKMKTIIILIDQLYQHGGIEKLVSIKANYWSEVFGYNVIIVSTEQNNNPTVYELSKKVRFIDIDVDYDRNISFFSPKNFAKIFSNVKKLNKIFDNYSPDFVVVASHIPMTYVLPFIKGKTKIIKEFHYSKFNRQHSKKEKAFSVIEKKYDYLVALSEEERIFYKSENVVVIPNPVFSVTSQLTEIFKKNKIAGAVLRVAPVKQIEKMIEVWEIFYHSNKDWQLHIYGTGDAKYLDNIKKMVEEKSLSTTIIFKGQTGNVTEAFSQMKVMLMTSANECFPMVILEANINGVPVVSFDSPTGPRNIINHNVDGIIVPLNNISAFAEELEHLVNDEHRMLLLSESAKVNAKNYLIENVMRSWKTQIFEKND